MRTSLARVLVLGVLLDEVLHGVRSLPGLQSLRARNPIDLDYRALSNARVWRVGPLQTDADRARVVEGMTGVTSRKGEKPGELASVIKSLPKRTFGVRDASEAGVLLAVRPRQTMSLLRGPMTEGEVRREISST